MMKFNGTPTENDVGEYIIRIYDKANFIDREFILKVYKIQQNI